MKNPRTFVIGGIVVLILLAVMVITVGTYRFLTAPDVAQQVPPTPIIVTLKTPLNGSAVQTNVPVSVDTEALSSRPITAMELWIDDTLMWTAASPPKTGEMRYLTLWSWTPTIEGHHTLVARAVDENGRTAQSNVVAVKVVHGEQLLSDQPVEQPIEQPVKQPAASPTTTSPEREPAPPYSGPVSDPPVSPPNKSIFWGASNLLPNPDPPAAPLLTASVEGCSVNLFIEDETDDESGFFIYRYGPLATDFGRITTLGSHDAAQPFQYTDADLFGRFMYYVAAFNPGGESISNLYTVTVNDPACLTDRWSKLALASGQITTTEPVDKLYCYLAVNDGPWVRMPAGPQTFLSPDQNGVFDVSAHLNTLVAPPSSAVLAFECWGWTDNTLLYLGAAKQAIPLQNQVAIQINTDQLQLAAVTQLDALQTLESSKPIPDVIVAPPINLRQTWDQGQCAAHVTPGLGQLFVPLICDGAMRDGYRILVWDWSEYNVPVCVAGSNPNMKSCPTTVTDITGFRLYQVGTGTAEKCTPDGCQPVDLAPYYAHVQSRADHHTTLFTISPEEPLLYCYVVRAYAKTLTGEVESVDSNMVCVQSRQRELFGFEDYGQKESEWERILREIEETWSEMLEAIVRNLL